MKVTDTPDQEPDDVLRRMLAMKPKPKEKGGEPKPAPTDASKRA